MTNTDEPANPRKQKSDGALETTDYPKPASTATTKSTKSNRSFKRDIRALMKVIIFIELIIVFGIISTLYVIAVKKVMRETIVWDCEDPPGVGLFDEFAVSSSSELCSELARTMYMEGYRLNLIAGTLQYCLNMQQPDRSGELGSSVALHYSSKGCRYTRGESRAPLNASLIEDFVAGVNKKMLRQGRGRYSELFPLDLVTTLGLLENATYQELEQIALLMKAEHGDKWITPATNNMDLLELEPLITEEITFWRRQHFSAKEKGEIETFPDFEDRMRHFVSLPDFRNSAKLEAYIRSRIEAQSVRGAPPLVIDPSPLKEVGDKYWNEGGMVSDGHGQNYCFPGEPSVAPLIFAILNGTDYNVMEKDGKLSHEQSARLLKSMMLELGSNIAKFEAPEEWRKFATYNKLMEEEDRPLVFNHFVLARHDEAYSYVGSIGSAYGSLYAVRFMNNLMNKVMEHFHAEKGFTNSFTPFIAVKNNLITVAYSGDGGLSSISMGIPRMLYTILRYSFYGENLEDAITAPLLYPHPFKENTAFSYHYPLRSKFAKSYLRNSDIVEVPSYYSDTVAAVSRRYERGYYVLVPLYKEKKPRDKWQYSSKTHGV